MNNKIKLIYSLLVLEETVLEIKRQSIIDLQKAVSQTEQKSNEILLREREQYQRLKAQTFEENYALLNRQEDGPEVRFFIRRIISMFEYFSNVGIVHEKQLKHVQVVILHAIVVNIVNIAIGNFIRNYADLIYNEN